MPVLHDRVTPGEPKFKDRPGTADDVVQVPTNVAGIAYYVNGELVTAPNGKVAVTGEATVVAVPDRLVLDRRRCDLGVERRTSTTDHAVEPVG